MALINCRHFNGYKPCGKNSSCDEGCSAQDLIKKNVLIIHLGALGSVVRTSALLRKFQNSYVVWLTSESVLPILKNHPAVDQLYALNLVNLLKLQAMSFDDIYVIDKSLEAVSVATQLKAKRVHGFKANPLNGAILPISEQANELWQIGLDNSKKFFENKKTELQLIFESLGFSYNNEPYWLHLTEAEKSKALKRKQTWLQQHNKKIIVGINTGCSTMIPYKKLSMQKHLELITEMQNSFKNIQIVLLGGQEDTERNQILASSFADVIASDSQSGLRDGIISVQACDIVISGAGNIGTRIAEILIKNLEPTVLVESDKTGKFSEDIRRQLPIVEGNPKNLETLIQANIKTAKSVICVTENDVDNLSIIQKAKSINPKIATEMSIFDKEMAVKLKYSLNEESIISSPLIAANYFMASLFFEGVLFAASFKKSLIIICDKNKWKPRASFNDERMYLRTDLNLKGKDLSIIEVLLN